MTLLESTHPAESLPLTPEAVVSLPDAEQSWQRLGDVAETVVSRLRAAKEELTLTSARKG